MAKKRKSRGTHAAEQVNESTKYDEEETFNDSQDEFYDGQDKILLAEEPLGKRRRKLEEEERHLQPSDEEVLSYQSFDDDEDNDNGTDGSKTGSSGEDEEDERDWGTARADYYHADAIETEADALEEEVEARRLQQRQMMGMSEADFGFDETAWGGDQTQSNKAGPVVEKLPQLIIPANATAEEKLTILRSRYPEFDLLAREFQDLQILREEYRMLPDFALKTQALSMYLGAIAMYFVIIAKDARAYGDATNITALTPTELRDHDVIANLMRAKQTWDAVKLLKKPESEKAILVNRVTLQETSPQVKTTKIAHRVDVGPMKKKIRRKPDEESVSRKTARETKHLNLQNLLATRTGSLSDESDFGDEDPLTAAQAEEKAKKKKTLRFYSSQIVQKASRRGMASREAGGDDDIPRKERLRERHERLLKEAEKRGQGTITENERLDEDEEPDGNVLREDDGYYQSLVARSSQKKADKKAKAEAYAEASRQGAQVFEAEQVGPDGKRAITYAIEKNKGLMPKRSKDVRNPRVKKRKKYEEKKKKLASTRQIYKGGEGRGGYAGELTGIKTNLVKSIKL